MTKKFTNKTSYSLLKTNPKLTGNIKLVVDSKGDIFIETIDASPELTRNKYKRVKLDINNDWSSAVYDLFNSGSIPESIFFGIKEDEDFYSIKTDYSKQYYTNYQQGAEPKISKLYNEQISYFAPLWLEPNDIPEHFAIFKINEPVSVSTKNETQSFSEDIENKIYNTNYFNQFGATGESDYFYETILSKAKLHKVFDMGPDSIIGSYLSKHINDPKVPQSSLTIDWNLNKQSTVNGISLKKSGFTNESFNLFSEAFPVDRTITEFDNLITNQFSKNGVVHPNIINLEFLFDDESNNEYEVSRYFGVYFNKNDISKFKLDSEAFYDKKYTNLPQNKDISSKYDVDVLSDSNIALENSNGIKLFVDYENDYKLLSSDIKGENFLPYIYSTDGLFYDINNNVDWESNEIILKDTSINTQDLKGYTKESLGIIPATKTNQEGRSYFEFTIQGTTNSFELRIRDVDEDSIDFDINKVFIGDFGIPAGTFIGNKFSLAGLPDDISNAVVGAINDYSEKDEDFNVLAITKFNKVIVFTRGTNAYWNNYEYLMFSDDANFVNVINVPYNTFINTSVYNADRAANLPIELPSFKDYNTIVSGATSMFVTPSQHILRQNFIGGNDNEKNRIRISKEFVSYFNNNLFLKTQDWYSQIVSICAYLDEPIFQNGKIVNFDDIDSYMTINSDSNIWVSPGAYCELYDVETNKVGLMSMYPIKQFDVDQFRSDYGKDGDGYIQKLKDNYIAKGGTASGATASGIQNSLKSFEEHGFKRLGGKLDEATGSIKQIQNEYDRLLENELPQLSIKGRIIPYINKWVYDDDGLDVRENNYRLNSNSAFSYDNFVPSNVNVLPDFRFFTHEWYYLQEYPPYLTTKEKIDSFSYFENKIIIGATGLADVNNDYFTNYFTQYKVDDKSFPKKSKYSIISGGNENSYGETFFRGAKIKFKRRVENIQGLNFNIENIGVYPSSEFNDYKFSAVLTNDTNKAIGYNLIENKKFKTITMFIEANLDDYYLSRGPIPSGATMGELFLDRTLLYTIQDKYNSTGNFADISISGAISPFIELSNGSLIANFTKIPAAVDGGTNYVINGLSNSDTDSLPNFDNEIIPDENGTYNKIEIEISTTAKIVIDNIISVTKNTITAKTFLLITAGTTNEIQENYINLYPTPTQCLSKMPIYLSGGFNAFIGILQDLSFASIYDKVNNGSPDISYTTINEDGSITKDTFIIEFELYSTNAKSDYLKTKGILFNGVKNSNFKPIGQETTALENTYVSTMYRFNGKYNPKVKDVVLFKDVYGATGDTKFTPEIVEKLRFTNTQFFSTYPGFALYKQLYINKINEQNPFTVLDLNIDSALRPEFWKLGEISLDKQDSYIFRSCWDSNYHRRYVSKINYERLPGYIEPKEVSSFLASTIMNIPEELKLEMYTFTDQILNSNFDITITRNSGNTISGVLNNTKKLVDSIRPNLVALFEKYVNYKFNFNQLDTLNDDIDRYIKTNILPRYFANNVYAYIKYSSKVSNEPLIVNNLTEQQLLIDGYIKLENIKFIKESFNEFDYNFIFSKPSDKSVTLAFFTNISIV